MRKLIGHSYDILITVVLFVLMVLGYGLYFLLYPFYRARGIVKVLSVLGLGLLLAAALLYGWFTGAAEAPRDRPFRESVLIFEKGSTLSSITRDLEKAGIVESGLQLKFLAALQGNSRKIKAGRYRLNSRMPLDTLLDILVRGSTYNNRVLIPEGLTSWQIASLLARQLNIDSSAIMKLVRDRDFIGSLGLDSPTLEGRLFPDTYEFAWNTTPSTVVRHLVERHLRVFRRLRRQHALPRGYNRYQVLILASIVETEAMVDSERSLIAGVFYNRLKKGMPLGADPTVRYAVRKYGDPLTRSDLRMDSPYNTRRFAGLPPGPICNPGTESLRAALDPADTPMLYFVARYDGTHRHFFSRTYQQHNRYKKRARRNLGRGIP